MQTNAYFIGSMSPSGYKTNFTDCIDRPGFFTYVLKGEASCSGFIKRIAAKRSELSKDLFYCAADPESIDAVIFPDAKIIVCDSIVPHLFEPKIAGLTGVIVNLSEWWDTDKLSAERTMLEELHNALINSSERAERCIKALSAVVFDNFDLAVRTLMLEKLDGFISRFTKKIFPKTNSAGTDIKRGTVSYRYMCALTSDGIKTLIPESGDIYIANDDYLAGSNYLLSHLVSETAARGFDVIVSRNPLMPSERGDVISHIAVPALNLYIFTSALYAPLIPPDRRRIINFTRFYTKSMLCAKKQRLRFNTEAAKSLLAEAVTALAAVRDVKRSAEKYYEKVIEPSAINEIEAKIIAKLS
jgi:hypothetical protein